MERCELLVKSVSASPTHRKCRNPQKHLDRLLAVRKTKNKFIPKAPNKLQKLFKQFLTLNLRLSLNAKSYGIRPSYASAEWTKAVFN